MRAGAFRIPRPSLRNTAPRSTANGPTAIWPTWTRGRWACSSTTASATSPDYAAALALDEDAVGIDLFIGEADLLGRGHGPAMLRAFLRDVAFPFHHLETCVIGPSVKNTAAIRAYEKAGFRALRLARVPDE